MNGKPAFRLGVLLVIGLVALFTVFGCRPQHAGDGQTPPKPSIEVGRPTPAQAAPASESSDAEPASEATEEIAPD